MPQNPQSTTEDTGDGFPPCSLAPLLSSVHCWAKLSDQKESAGSLWHSGLRHTSSCCGIAVPQSSAGPHRSRAELDLIVTEVKAWIGRLEWDGELQRWVSGSSGSDHLQSGHLICIGFLQCSGGCLANSECSPLDH